MLSRPSSLIDLIRRSDSLRRISQYLPAIAPVFGIQESACLTIRPSGLSPLNFPELPPSTSAGRLTRAHQQLSSVSTLAGHRVGKRNSWRIHCPTSSFASKPISFAQNQRLSIRRILLPDNSAGNMENFLLPSWCREAGSFLPLQWVASPRNAVKYFKPIRLASDFPFCTLAPCAPNASKIIQHAEW